MYKYTRKSRTACGGTRIDVVNSHQSMSEKEVDDYFVYAEKQNMKAELAYLRTELCHRRGILDIAKAGENSYAAFNEKIPNGVALERITAQADYNDVQQAIEGLECILKE